MSRTDVTTTGEQIAAILATSWRRKTSPLEMTPEVLCKITSPLVNSGAAALAWWRIRQTELGTTTAAAPLQLAYFHQKIATDEQIADLIAFFTLLNSAGIDAILHKGWAAGRAYPRQGLRPVGDIDLITHPQQHAAVEDLLKNLGAQQYQVDLKHKEITELSERTLEDLFAHSQVVRLRKAQVRVLGPEDNLRLLSLHLLRHYAYRPLWLCDIAALLESRPADFNWDYCLGGDRQQANWVATAISLAHRLLGAELENVPISTKAKNPPSFLLREVLQYWAAGHRNWPLPQRAKARMHTYLRHPEGMMEDLGNHWPSSLEVAVELRKSFNRPPRLSQLASGLSRAIRFFLRLPSDLREAE